MKTAKTVHDQKLDRWGDRTESHSTNPLPYSKNLARKKKFQKSQEKLEAVMDFSVFYCCALFTADYHGLQGIRLGRADLTSAQLTFQYMELCKGRDLRPVSTTSKLYCKFSRGNHPTYIIGPLRLEVQYIMSC